jgi:hypothetical protein
MNQPTEPNDIEIIQSTEVGAIPAIEEPEFATEYFGDDDDEVIVVDVGDEQPRAYPVRVLHYHEMAHDRIGETPILVTWCVICGSAIVYDRTVGGRSLTFAQSGKLADDAMVVFDRETGSEWKQTTGVCIAGELDGEELSVVTSRLTTWRQFRREHPDGVVLQPPGGESEASGASSEPEPIDYDDDFAGYREGEGFGRYALYQYLGRRPTIHYDPAAGEWTEITDSDHYSSPRGWNHDLPPKTPVLGVEVGGERVGFAQPHVEKRDGVVRATVGEWSVVVFGTPDGLFAYEDPGYEFRSAGGGEFEADGTTWDGATGSAADGRMLSTVPTRRMFVFAWADAYGYDTLHTPPVDEPTAQEADDA